MVRWRFDGGSGGSSFSQTGRGVLGVANVPCGRVGVGTVPAPWPCPWPGVAVGVAVAVAPVSASGFGAINSPFSTTTIFYIISFYPVSPRRYNA